MVDVSAVHGTPAAMFPPDLHRAFATLATDAHTEKAAGAATDQEHHARMLTALEEERAGYITRGLPARVAQVDEEIHRVRSLLT